MATSKSRSPVVPLPRSLHSAIEASEALASLASRLDESTRRFAAVKPLLPEALARELRPGPIDDDAWTLLASNAAVAAKMRHWLPRLAEALRDHGWRELPIRVHLRSR
jgi:Dna[CI] antecedent, DciA